MLIGFRIVDLAGKFKYYQWEHSSNFKSKQFLIIEIFCEIRNSNFCRCLNIRHVVLTCHMLILRFIFALKLLKKCLFFNGLYGLAC